MPPQKINSLSRNYNHGDLSVFPKAIDNKLTLFYASNNAETRLRHQINPISKYIIVDDASLFPETGLIKIADEAGNSETINYHQKIGNQFHLLQRSYDQKGSGHWQAGCRVSCPVMADHHNALKDAIIKIQRKLGLPNNPDDNSIHGILAKLEQKWLSPKASFRAFPKIGPPSLIVKFQNFSIGEGSRFLWDFGDGTTSTDKSPEHTFTDEGIYSIKLNIITSTGNKGFTEKSNYINVTNDQKKSIFYCRPFDGKSMQTNFKFIDQTDGEIIERHWFFGDGEDIAFKNPNIHTVDHIYKKPGNYSPILLIRYYNEKINRVTLNESITVF